MSYLNLTPDDVSVITEFFYYVDSNRDGFISVAEIKEACAVDINGDGVISEDEKTKCAAAWLGSVFFKEDANQDQRLTLAELLAFNNEYRGSAIM